MTLDVCPKCGWFDHGPTSVIEHRCEPELGAIVKRFAEALLEACPESVKLIQRGYGDRRFAIKVHDSTLVFQPYNDGSFRLEKVFGVSDLTPDTVIELVEALL